MPMTRPATILAAMAFALCAHAATLPAKDPAALAAAFKAAQPGDTIALAANPAWGDGGVANVAFAAPGVTITSADPKAPAVFRSFVVDTASGLNFDGVNVSFTPDASTVDWSAFLKISNSHDVAWRHSVIHGGRAITGVPENATLAQQNADTTGNVIGRPTGYGAYIYASQNIIFEFNDVSGADRTLILSAVSDSLIGHNYFHDRRRTGVVGAGVNRVIINGNVVDGAVPWNWNNGAGVIGYADHADMMAFYSASGQTTPNDGLTITNNLMAQRAGANILGMWAAGSPGAGFTNLTVAGNLILAPNLQGIMLSDTTGASVHDNTLVQVPLPSMTADQLAKQFPTVLLLAPDAGSATTGIAMTNNAVGVAISDRSGGVNPQSGTTLTTPTRDLGASEIRAWLPAHPDMVALAANLLPALPPVPTPPAVDPRDAQIADLTAKLTATAAQVAVLTQQLADAKAAGVVSLGQVTALQAQLASAQASLATAQQNATALAAKLAVDDAKLAGLRAAVAP